MSEIMLTFCTSVAIAAATAGILKFYKVKVFDAVLFGLMLGSAYFLYSRYGSSYYIERWGGSIFGWIAMQWRAEDFSNNWLMIVFAGFVVWRERKEYQATEKHPSYLGMTVALGALALHILAHRSQLPRISLLTVTLLFWGCCYAIWGWKIARRLLFPVGYVMLCFSSYHLMHFTMRLRLIATALAELFLQGINIATVRQGTILYSSAGGGFQFDVADACSGLRSLITMTALAAPYAYFTMKGTWRKWTLFLLSVPLAMLANTLRIFTLGVVAEWIGMKLAMSLYHDASGFIVFMFSIGLLIGTGNLLSKDWKTLWTSLTQRITSRT